VPRVHTQTARKSKYERTCSMCRGAIYPGQSYHSWSFRYGGTYYQHAACGYPRRSQLTQSAMGEVYAAIEAAEETIANWDGDGLGDLTSAVEEVAAATESVIDQYREADEAFGGYGATESAERGEEPEEGEPRTEDQQDEFDTWVEEQRGEATDLLANCPL